MKKALLLLTLLIASQAAFAYIEEYTTSDMKTLNGTGYSQEAMKIIDTSRMLKQGAEKDYVPYYPKEYYSKNIFVKWYQVAKRYLDPAQDENTLGTREMKFSNDWFDVSPSYNSKKNPNNRFQSVSDKQIERLDKAGKQIKGSNGQENTEIEAVNKQSEDEEIETIEYESGIILENL